MNKLLLFLFDFILFWHLHNFTGRWISPLFSYRVLFSSSSFSPSSSSSFSEFLVQMPSQMDLSRYIIYCLIYNIVFVYLYAFSEREINRFTVWMFCLFISVCPHSCGDFALRDNVIEMLQKAFFFFEKLIDQHGTFFNHIQHSHTHCVYNGRE